MDSALLGAMLAKEQLEEADIIDLERVSNLKLLPVNLLGLNITLAALEVTALKSVGDLVTVGVFLAVAVGREPVCLKLCPRSAETDKDRLFLGSCFLPLLPGV